MFQPDLSLSPASRIAAGLKIVKAGLWPHIADRIRASGTDPLKALPPSSPVLKHGFEPDARAALIILKAYTGLLTDTSEARSCQSSVRKLLRYRDLWAHQQPLNQNDADDFLKNTAGLLDTLSRSPEASAARYLTSWPDADVSDQLTWFFEETENPGPFPLSDVCSALALDDFPADLSRLMKALVWDAACALTLSRPPYALLITQKGLPDVFPGEENLPARLFWWVVDLPHNAPVEEKRARHREFLQTLEADH